MQDIYKETEFVSRRGFVKLSAVATALTLVSCHEAGKDKAVQSPAAQTSSTDLSNISHRKIQTNGINMHIAETGSGPPIIFLHGFGELWYSWRHQLPAIAAAGYHAIAPDLRGFGATDVPQDVESYSTENRAADVVGVLDALNAKTCVLVGNDWGSGLAWALAQLYPERVAAMFHLNIPFLPRGEETPTISIGKFAQGHFNFGLHVQKPGIAEAEFEKDVKASVRRFLYAFSGEAPPETVHYLFMEKKSDKDVLEGMPEPEKLPAWLTEADIDYYEKNTGALAFAAL